MKVVLNINYNMNIGGIEEFLMNVYRNLKKENYRIIFLCYDKNQDYEKEINDTGSKIYYLPYPEKSGRIRYIKNLKKIIKKENVDIVHINTYFNSIYPLIAAFLSKVKTRVVHSHSNYVTKNIFRKIYWFLCKVGISILSTDKLACSKEAGKKIFFGKFKIIPNGININKFVFNEKVREEVRKEYNIKNEDIILGHVGRLDPIKNHIFILETLVELLKTNPNYKALFIGDGKELGNIKTFIKEHKLENNVILTGSRTDAYRYYNAFDLFLLPSKAEGLGIVLIEAQINGLICIASEIVPREINETGNVKFLPFEVSSWKDEIINTNIKRDITKNYAKESKYSIENTIKMIEEIYSK